jgi:hypothetical protein
MNKTISFLAISNCILLLYGCYVYTTNGNIKRFPTQLMELIEPDKTRIKNKCKWLSVSSENLRICIFGSEQSNTKLIIYGDSHAEALYDELNQLLLEREIKGIFLQNDNCILPKIEDVKNNLQKINCEKSLQGIAQVMREENPSYTMISLRWTYRIYPLINNSNRIFDNKEGGIERGNSVIRNAIKKTTVELDQNKQDNLYSLLDILLVENGRTFIIYQVPEVGWNVPMLNFKNYLNGNFGVDITTSKNVYIQRTSVIKKWLDEYVKKRAIDKIEPENIFCNHEYYPERCVAQYKNQPYYYDDNHLSNMGAKKLLNAFSKELDADKNRN